jgi:4-hydroxy-4-methyl-2-oxoglutarate aldolase
MSDSPEKLADAFLELGSACLGDTGGRTMQERVREAWAGARLAAPAYTVQCTPGDNLAIHAAVANAPEGYALVVSCGDLRERGYFGEVLTVAAQSRGLAGLVIDAGVRDIDAIENREFPVFSSCIALKSATKNQPGSVGEPIRCGGATVETDDWVVCDADGVTVVPFETVEEVLQGGRDRAEKEQGFFEALQVGSTTIELLSLDTSPITGL